MKRKVARVGTAGVIVLVLVAALGFFFLSGSPSTDESAFAQERSINTANRLDEQTQALVKEMMQDREKFAFPDVFTRDYRQHVLRQFSSASAMTPLTEVVLCAGQVVVDHDPASGEPILEKAVLSVRMFQPGDVPYCVVWATLYDGTDLWVAAVPIALPGDPPTFNGYITAIATDGPVIFLLRTHPGDPNTSPRRAIIALTPKSVPPQPAK